MPKKAKDLSVKKYYYKNIDISHIKKTNRLWCTVKLTFRTKLTLKKNVVDTKIIGGIK